MTTQPIRVGLIGAAPDRGWAANAHIPALRVMPQFSLAAVCTTRAESAQATADKFGIPIALCDWKELVARDDIDLVIVAVKVGAHRDLVLGALNAGKHVFSEWPLAMDVGEAQEMRDAAERSGVRHMVGLQGRAHPVLAKVKAMVEGGEIGDLISVTLSSSLASWGPRLPPAEEYRADHTNGATALTIPGGHTLDSLRFTFGDLRELSALLTTQHKQTEIIGTGRTVPVTSPDQLLLNGRLANGAVMGVHIKADMAVPMGVRLEVNGREGDLLVTSRTLPGQDPVGLQRAELVLSKAKRGSKDYAEVAVPRDDLVSPDVPAGAAYYTARLLARLAAAIRSGERATPDFADALETHRLLDVIQRSSDSGRRLAFES